MADEDTDQFSLRWNNFHSNLTDGFHALLQGEDLVDVTLAAGGKFVQAHKIVLSVCSPYFKELFKVNPCKHPIVILKDVSHKELVAILQFMYKGEVNVRQEELPAFLKTAETLQIKGLTGDDYGPEEKDSPRPPMMRSKDSAYNRHSLPVALHRHAAPSQSFRPAKRSRLEVPSTSTLVPIPSPAREKVLPAVSFLEMHTPKTEPIDEYESDIEVLNSKTEAVINLLTGDTSRSHQDDSDSHHSHYDTTLPQLDTSQALAANSQASLDTSHPHLNNSPHGSGMFSEISGTSHAQDGSQDGTQGYWTIGDMPITESNSQTSSTLFQCTECPKTFTLKKCLHQHIRNSHGDFRGPFICSVCQKIFKNVNSLRSHKINVHRLKKTSH